MISRDDPPAVLIVALSGRALAACARRGGYRPLVADMFRDLDTRALAEVSERVPGTLARGFAESDLLACVDRLSAGRSVIGVVVGAGFEDRPDLLRAIAARHRLLGNTPEAIVAVKDPMVFAETCRTALVPHPETTLEEAGKGDWLRKRAGSSGGVDVLPLPRRTVRRRGLYYQRRVAGEPVSALFLAAGGKCRVLGLSRQWADPTPRLPFRYGGASRPARIGPAGVARIQEAVARLVPHTGLRGLNSADFVVREDGIDLLEVNPRPGATLDIFADRDGALFGLHLDACAGRLPEAAPAWPPASAAATVYADADIRLPVEFDWPEWTADRQPHGEAVSRGGPLCTVLAEAADAAGAERLARERAALIRDRTRKVVS